jgi:hypothetical protein
VVTKPRNVHADVIGGLDAHLALAGRYRLAVDFYFYDIIAHG